MKKQLGLVSILILAILLAACQVGARSSAQDEQVTKPLGGGAAPAAGEDSARSAAGTAPSVSSEQYARQQATSGQADVDPQTGLNRMVVYNAELALIVQDTLQAVEAARKIVQEAGGYIAESSSYRDDDQLRATMTVRVPSEKLAGALEQLKKIALTVDRENLKGEDVTDQYADLETRLRVDEARRDRYLALLERADKIEDVLAVQQKLDETIAQIEQSKGRMEYLSKSAAFATIHLSLTPDALARPLSIGGWQPQGTARNALEALVWALRTLGDILIWAVICVLPMALIVGGPLYLAIGWVARRRRKPPAAAPKTEELNKTDSK